MKKAKTSLKKVNEWCKKTRDSLQKSEEIYRILIENMNDVIFLLDTQGYIIYISPVLEQVSQYTVDEIVGRNFSSFVHPDDLSDLLRRFKATLAGHIAPHEFRIFNKDGSIVSVRTYSRPLLKDGQLLGLTGVITDISECQKAEKDLQRFIDIVNNIQLGLYIYQLENLDDDTTLRLIIANQAAAELIGVPIEKMVDKTLDEVFPGLREKGIPQKCAEGVRLQEPIDIEDMYYDDNISGWFRMKAFPLPENCVGISFENISDRKQAEEALRQSEERYRRITEAITDYIYTVRVQDGHPVETTHSSTCVAVTGYTAREFQANPYLWIEMVHKDDRESVQKLAANIITGLKPKPLEHRITQKDGTLRWVRNTSVPHYDNQGRLVSYDGLVQDITERKQMELALEEERTSLAQKVKDHTAELNRANAELARTARLKDEFLATMSHELRTPLNVVLGMSEALQREIYGPLNPKQCKALRSVEENGRHLLELITDILDLSNISTGELKLDIAPVAIELVCQASLRAIHHIAYKKRLKTSSMCDSMVTTIYADGLRLKQVLVNLLNNAVKFTPEGGAIGLEVEGDAENHVVHFTVWDTGIGIANEEIERLFQPFVQLDGKLSRKYEGTGLGLTLVYRIVDMHGGGISVESEIGKGSRFTVSLPWKEAEESALRVANSVFRVETESPLSPHPSPYPPHPATILIADGNEMTIQSLSKYLAAEGYRVTIAYNGGEAFASIRENCPDIIVIDIHMPEINGLEAIRYIRSDEQSKSIPIIALSALIIPGDCEKWLAAGVDEYLSKPVSVEKLSEIIEDLLARREQVQG